MDNNINLNSIKGIEEGLTITIGDLFKANAIAHDAYVHVVINIDEDVIIDKYITSYDLYTDGNGTTIAGYDCSVIFRSKLTKLTASLVDGKPFINIEGSLMTCDIITLLLYEMINLKNKNDKMIVNIVKRDDNTETYTFSNAKLDDNSPIDTKYTTITYLLVTILGVDICKTKYKCMISAYIEDHAKEVIIKL